MSRVRSNVVANIAGQAWTVLLSLACTPFYIAFLGVEAYGLIAAFFVVQTLLQLLDFGLASTINRELARSDPGERRRLADLLATAQAWYWLLGFVLGAVFFAALPSLARWWLNPQRIGPDELENAARAFSVFLIAQWPVGFYISAIAGLQKQVAANAIQIPLVTLSSVGGVVLIWLGPRSVAALLLWQAGVYVLLVAMLRKYLRSQLGETIAAGRRTVAAFRGVWRFSLGMSGISITGAAITHLDKLVLGKLLSLEVLGYYTLGSTVARGLYVLVTPVFTAYYPRLSLLAAKGDPSAVQQAYHAATQLMAVLVVPLAAVIGLFPSEILSLWLRNTDIAHAVAPLAALLVLGTCLNALMNVPFALQLAYGNTRIGLSINILLVALLIPSLLFAATHFGAVGGAAMWALCNALYLAIGLPATQRALLGEGLGRWLRNDILPPVLAALAVVALVRWLIPAPIAGLKSLLVLLAVWGAATLAAMSASSALRAWSRQALSARSS